MNKKSSFYQLRLLVLAALSVIFLAGFGFLLTDTDVSAAVNEQINYQGRLLDDTGAVVADGTYNLTFKIYSGGDGAPGGSSETLEWTETREGGDKVTVTNGYFSVNLGSVNDFGTDVDWNEGVLWLGVEVGGTGTPDYADGVLSPYKRFAANPYALNSLQFNGLSSGSFVQLAQGVQADSSTTNPSVFLNKTGGTANILQFQRGGTDVFVIGNGGSVDFTTTTDSTTGFQVNDANGGTSVFNVDTDNERVGIRTDSPTAELQANGQVVIGSGEPLFDSLLPGLADLTIQKDNGYAIQGFEVHSATAAESGGFFAARGRGTQASPTASQSGDTLFQLGATGFTDDTTSIPGNLVGSQAALVFYQDAASTASSTPAGISFRTGAAAERLRITSGGNIGIGGLDDTPDATVEIVNDGSGDSFIVADTNDGDSTPFIIQSDGDVGIGTDSPGNRLEVVAGNSSSSPTIKARTTDADSAASYMLQNDASSWVVAVDGTDSDKFKILDVTSGANTRFTIDSNGRAGFGGETSPAHELDVAGSIRLGDDTSNNNELNTSAGSATTADLYWGNDLLCDVSATDCGIGGGSGANTALSNLASVAINTSLLPGFDDTIDLGDNTHRWRDLFLGPGTLHIGTSTSDEFTIGYDTTNNTMEVQPVVDSVEGFQVRDSNGGTSVFNVDTDNERVGIGDDSPTNTFTVNGTADFQGHIAVGNGSAVDGLTTGADGLALVDNTNGPLQVYETTSLDGGTDTRYQALGGFLKLNPSSAPSYNQAYGMFGGVEVPPANSQNFSNLVAGISGATIHAGSGTVTEAQGINNTILNLSDSGTITQAVGQNIFLLNANSTFSGGGTVDTFKGIEIDTPINLGTVNNNYGLAIADQSSVGSSNSYNFFSAGTASKNVLQGLTTVGNDTSPDAQLEVTNDGSGDSFRVNDNTSGDSSPFVIQSDGDTGIGESSPAAKLDVAGAVRLGADTSDNNQLNTTAGSATTADLYWGNDLLCDVSATDCGGSGGGDLDTAYDADSDKLLAVDSATGLLLDMTTIGDFEVQDNGTTFFKLNDTGSYTYTLDATDNPSYLITNSGSADVTTNLAGTGDFAIQDNGTTSFAVSDSGALHLGKADGGVQVTVGDSSASTTPNLFVLDQKSDTNDPSGTNGAMYYNDNMDSFRCYADGAWKNCSTFQIERGFEVQEEFMTGLTTTGNIGQNAWAFVSTGTSTLAYNGITPTADRPGSFQITTGAAAATNGTTLCLASACTAAQSPMIIRKDLTIKAAATPGATTTNNQLRVGATTQITNAQPVSGVWWEADATTNANWRYCFGTGAAATCAASSVAVTASTFRRLEIRVTATGAGTSAATFIIDGNSYNVSGVTIDSTNRVLPNFACYTSTTAARVCSIDYYQIRGVSSTAR